MKFNHFKLSKKYARVSRWMLFAMVAVVLAGSSMALALTLPTSRNSALAVDEAHPAITEYAKLVRDVRKLQDMQKQAHIEVVSNAQLQKSLAEVQTDLKDRRLEQANTGIRAMRASLTGWERDLASRTGKQTAITASAGGIFLPIVLYHYTPSNFDAQLAHLDHAGYTAIDLDQALAGMHGAPLPAKPVVITFDDGFSNQLQAFEILKRHHMKATFYIINGGATSRWCLGAGRRYNDPLQPPSGCGDSYMNWNQIRMLDQSGMITIGGHTLDHENLAALSPSEQRREIADSKTGIEQQLGHPIKHFAYPYGAYNQTSIQIAHDAGYQTAVTVAPGANQTPGTDFTLKRVRDTLTLP